MVIKIKIAAGEKRRVRREGSNHMNEETVDEILDGTLRVRQGRTGYRFNLDSLLLGHFVSLKPRSVNLDLGCGNGILALVLASRYPLTHWTGLEIQEGLAGLSHRNVGENGLQERVKIFCGDAREVRNQFAEKSFDNVVFNPPYRKLSSGRMNPLPEKAVARHEIKGSLRDFLAASAYLLKPSGRVFTIYPAKRLVELVALFRQNHIEPKRMRLVFSDVASDAEFVLVEGRKGAREELKMEPPLFIYDRPGKYTKAMEEVFTGLASPQGSGAG